MTIIRATGPGKLMGYPKEEWPEEWWAKAQEALRNNTGFPKGLAEQAHIIKVRLAAERVMQMRIWPEDAKFFYGDPVHAIRKHPDSTYFEGHVVGWYQPKRTNIYGYNVEQLNTGLVHVYSQKALAEGLYNGEG